MVMETFWAVLKWSWKPSEQCENGHGNLLGSVEWSLKPSEQCENGHGNLRGSVEMVMETFWAVLK